MRKALRIAGRTVIVVIALLSVVLAVSAYRYKREMAIDTSRGVNESGYVRATWRSSGTGICFSLAILIDT